ncbi:hypothetical protein Q7C36_001254 [Tachysurus vachellii]|uniref:Organic solute transporter subunit beta n=1 Tax=Tachysurus vachellii TaxID=175792 RepID=A0AA88P389_TACVA|nr:hypothetical protein Q7C36_001254 [Tachysurus vachellii]
MNWINLLPCDLWKLPVSCAGIFQFRPTPELRIPVLADCSGSSCRNAVGVDNTVHHVARNKQLHDPQQSGTPVPGGLARRCRSSVKEMQCGLRAPAMGLDRADVPHECVQQGSLTLINTGKRTRWTSLDQGDICQEKLRSRKQRDTDEFPSTEDTMTEEQREYLRWYYRTEDATPWKFAMLGLSLVVLLMGCVLCIMGLMSNKHRREIAKYKTAAAASPALVKVEMEELQIITVSKEDKNSYPDPTQDGQLESKAPLEEASETEALNPGEIMVTWKDGTASKLYSDSNEEGEEDK